MLRIMLKDLTPTKDNLLKWTGAFLLIVCFIVLVGAIMLGAHALEILTGLPRFYIYSVVIVASAVLFWAFSARDRAVAERKRNRRG